MNTNLVNIIPQFLDPSAGTILASGTLETYVASTSTPLATYPTNADAIAGTNANSTTITITNGYPKSGSNVIGVFLRPGKQYKFILKDASSVTLWTLDAISNLTDTIYDGNGNEVIKLVGVTSAVNEITVTNAATGNAPSIAATGDDTNVGLTLKTKGTGTMSFLDGSNNELFKTADVALAVNEVTLTNAITTTAPSVSATGDDTNIGLTVKSKGTGAAILQGAVQLNDSNGNELLKTVTTASAINELTITNAATGNGAILAATGDDTNIDLRLQAKGTGSYRLMGTATQASKLLLSEQTGNGTNVVGFQAPTSIASDSVWILPGADGSSGQVIQTNGSGTISFASHGTVLLGKTTASSSASVAFTGLASTLYAGYLVTFNSVIPQTNTTIFCCQLSRNSGFITSGYSTVVFRASSAGTGQSGAGAASRWEITPTETIGTGANQTLNGWLYIPNDALTLKSAIWQTAGIAASAALLVGTGGGVVNDGASAFLVDGMTFFQSSGNIASGTISVFGLTNT